MKAMVLCAGLGTRLRPLTNTIPKPLVPSPDRPLVFRTLDRLVDAGVDLFVVNLHHKPDVVKAAIGNNWRGVDVVYSEELPDILGPTGGLRKAVDCFGDEPFIVVNGDVYFEVDFRALFDFHIETSAGLTMAVKVDAPEAKINAVAFSSEGMVRQLWGAPTRDGEILSAGINAGAFVYDPAVIRRFVPPGIPYGFREDFMPALFDADVKIAAFQYSGYWSDIGDTASYLNFVADALTGSVPGISTGHTVIASVSIAEGAEIVSPCFIDEGCEIGAGARVGPCVVMCADASVGAGALVEKCVIAPGARVQPRCIVSDSIITNE